MLRAFDEIESPDVSVLGGKARSLVLLTTAGFPVPRGFVVEVDEFRAHVESDALRERIRSILQEVSRANAGTKSRELMELVISSTPEESLQRSVEASLSALRTSRVAVRSSAVSEDSSGASFAGLHDTFLDIETLPEEVLSRIVRVWSSLFSERALVYRQIKCLPMMEGMAVVVQEMVPARVSGVTFTAHPDTGEQGVLIVECASGLGADLVGGRITPNRYLVKKVSQEVVESVETEDDLITKEELNHVTEMCLAIEAYFEYPQDIEWSIAGNRLHVLQSRRLSITRR